MEPLNRGVVCTLSVLIGSKDLHGLLRQLFLPILDLIGMDVIVVG